MINRRDFLGIAAGAAALTFTPQLLGALQPAGAKLIERAIPSTGEKLPVIGLGRGWARSLDPAAIKEVIKTLIDNGGKVVDTVHGGPEVRELVGTVASELGFQDKIFWATGLLVTGGGPGGQGQGGPPPKAEPAAVKAELERLLAMLKVDRIDLIQVLAHADLPTHFAVLSEMKQEGRIRYIGVTDLLPPPNMPAPPDMGVPRLESIMRNEQIDFVGFDYSVGDRRAEETLLPLAQERKIAVLAYFPFDRNRIFPRAGTDPLPEWAADFDATTWAQFFLKYVVSHPAVTVARAGTSNPRHMLDNIGGGIGRLPDEATRKRMAELVDSWPQPKRGG